MLKTLDKVLLPCKNCGAKNRVAVNKLTEHPVCGNCKSEIEILNKPVSVNAANFENEVKKWPGVVLVDFWAEWCPPCKMLGPVLDTISKEKAGIIKIAKVNTEIAPDLSRQFQISSIPTLILFENGKMLGRTSGAMPKPALLNWIDSLI